MKHRASWRYAKRCAGPFFLLAASAIVLVDVARGATATPAEAVVPDDSTPIRHVTFVAFDTETTGLSTRHARVVEMGAVRFREGVILASTNWLIHPGIPIPENAARVHGITDAEVSHCPPFETIFPFFKNFARGSILLAYNASFDIRVIQSELRRRSRDFPPFKVLDALKLMRQCCPGLSSYTLGAAARHMGVEPRAAHRAHGDAETLAKLAIAVLARFPPEATLADVTRAAGGWVTLPPSLPAAPGEKAPQRVID